MRKRESTLLSPLKMLHIKVISNSKILNARGKTTKYIMIGLTSRLSNKVKQKYRKNMAHKFSETNCTGVNSAPQFEPRTNTGSRAVNHVKKWRYLAFVKGKYSYTWVSLPDWGFSLKTQLSFTHFLAISQNFQAWGEVEDTPE